MTISEDPLTFLHYYLVEEKSYHLTKPVTRITKVVDIKVFQKI